MFLDKIEVIWNVILKEVIKGASIPNTAWMKLVS